MVFDFLRKPAPVTAGTERKASAVGRVVAWGAGGRVAWSPRDAVVAGADGVSGKPDRLSGGAADCRGGGGLAPGLPGQPSGAMRRIRCWT